MLSSVAHRGLSSGAFLGSCWVKGVPQAGLGRGRAAGGLCFSAASPATITFLLITDQQCEGTLQLLPWASPSLHVRIHSFSVHSMP